MNGEEAVMKKRKVRSDKKREVKPTINDELKNCIYSLSYITGKPVKDIAETICIKGISSRKTIDYLSQYFRRNYQFMSTVYIGDFGRASLQRKYQSGKNERISIRFTNPMYEQIYVLSNAMDCTPSKTTALLLDASIRNVNLLNSIVKLYLHENVDNAKMKELKHIMKYINQNNPYDEEISWPSLLLLIYDEIKDRTSDVSQTISSWIKKHS